MKLERRSQITDLIKQQRTVKNEELMARFGISIETIHPGFGLTRFKAELTDPEYYSLFVDGDITVDVVKED